MGFSMILPMVVEDQRQFSAMSYGVAVMIGTQLIPAIISLNKGIRTLGVTSAIASGGLTVLAMGVGALAAYAGFEIFDDIFGDKLRSQVDDIAELNSELDTTASILKDLQGPSGGGAVLPGLIDVSYNDLKQNSDLTIKTYEDVQNRLDGLRANREAAEKAGESDLASMYSERINEMEVIESKIKSIRDAQKLVNGEMQIATEEMKNQLTIEDQRFSGVHGLPAQRFVVGFDYDGDGKIDDETFRTEDLYSFQDTDGFTEDYYDMQKKAYKKYTNERDKLKVDYANEDHMFMVDYYTNLLTVTEDGNQALIDADRVMYDTLARDQEEFANAREELFFGERSNFTGAIYKQITQGGVESVLHRVEFIQTNNFNGMVLEEMVEQVSRGVVDELRSLGVPL